MTLEFNVAEMIGTTGVKVLKLFGEFTENDTFVFKCSRQISGEWLLAKLEEIAKG